VVGSKRIYPTHSAKEASLLMEVSPANLMSGKVKKQIKESNQLSSLQEGEGIERSTARTKEGRLRLRL